MEALGCEQERRKWWRRYVGGWIRQGDKRIEGGQLVGPRRRVGQRATGASLRPVCRPQAFPKILTLMGRVIPYNFVIIPPVVIGEMAPKFRWG